VRGVPQSSRPLALHATVAIIDGRRASGIEFGDRVGALIAGGLRKILIAGAADTGLLALVLRAAANNNVHICVLDICETPLELCRRVAHEWSLPIDTLKLDLRRLDVEQQFELVLVHGTLHFIAAADRHDVLNRIRRALGPGLLFNTGKPSSTAEIGDQFLIIESA
jgi:SAM-dependent methyltransferase